MVGPEEETEAERKGKDQSSSSISHQATQTNLIQDNHKVIEDYDFLDPVQDNYKVIEEYDFLDPQRAGRGPPKFIHVPSHPPVLMFEKKKLRFLYLPINQLHFANDPHGSSYELHLSIAKCQTVSPHDYVLRHEWNKIVTSNGLEEGCRVEGWQYRHGHQLHLALKFLVIFMYALV